MKAKVTIRSLAVGQLQANCYILIDELHNRALIIDPGDDAEYISQIIADHRAKPRAILATHGHFDHLMAATELQLAYNIPFFIHRKDKFLVNRLNDSSRHFIGIPGGPPPRITAYLKQGKAINLGRTRLEVIETPGHTPGSVALYCPKRSTVFVGDLLFARGGVGRTDFSYSSPADLATSIQKILNLPSQTTIYPGHGPQTTVNAERPFHL